MCKEMNAPVLPESKKVNATVTNSFTLDAGYNFVFNNEFIESIQMNSRDHDCLCVPSRPMIHYCCPGCRDGRYIPTDEDRRDLQPVLKDYNFDERDSERVIKQILDLIMRNFPLSVYAYGKGHQAETKMTAIPTLFFADIDSVHRFAGHIAHACEDYYYHEEYLHTVYHSSMYDTDWAPVNSAHTMFGQLQISSNRLHNRLVMGYLGGGVGTGYVGPRSKAVADILAQDGRVEACRGVLGIYLLDGDGARYNVNRIHYVPHGPIAGEVVKWSPEWIGDLLDEDDGDGDV